MMLEIDPVDLVKRNDSVMRHDSRIRKIVYIAGVNRLAAFKAIHKIVAGVEPQFYLFALQQNELILRIGRHSTAQKNQGRKEISLHSIRITR